MTTWTTYGVICNRWGCISIRYSRTATSELGARAEAQAAGWRVEASQGDFQTAALIDVCPAHGTDA